MNLLELFVKIGAKDEASGVISRVSEGAIKTLSVAAGAASTAVSVLTKKVISGYGEYEQLVGGVETLFGAGGKSIEQYAESMGKSVESVADEYAALEQAQSIALSNANNAWKNQGMSVNDYMQAVTSFAASLKQGLGGDAVKAAKLADLALTDMADNANKMGTSMESIQNAYNGFAKQNYTMLDNLKLGYGGTAKEMVRLINDSGVLSKKIKNLDGVTFDQIIEAIHAVQDNLGITGTTAEEAEKTIQGSINAMKSAWGNLIVGIADDNADFDTLVGNFVDSASTAGKNIMPRIEKSLSGIGKLAEKLAPVISEQMPGLVKNVLPSLLSASKVMVVSAGEAVVQAIPAVLETVYNAFRAMLDEVGWLDEFDSIVEGVTGVFSKVKEKVEEVFPPVKQSVTDAFDRISEAISPVTEYIGGLIEKIDTYFSSGEAATDATDTLSSSIEGVAGFITAFSDGVATAVEGVRSLVDWLTSGSAGAEALLAVVVSLTTAIATYTAITKGIALAQKAWAAIQVALTTIQNGVATAQAAVNAVMSANPIILIVTAIAALVAGFIYLWNTSDEFRAFWVNLWETISSAFSTAWNAIVEFFTSTLPTAFDNFVGLIKSLPSKVVGSALALVESIKSAIAGKISEIVSKGKEIVDGVISGITDKISEITAKGKEIVDTIKKAVTDKVEEMKTTGGRLLEGLWSGISDKVEWLKSKVSGVVDKIKSWFTGEDGFDEHSPSKWAAHVGEYVMQGLSNGMDSKVGSVYKSWNGMMGNLSANSDFGVSVGAGQGAYGGRVVNITFNSPSISQADIDYIIARANSELGVAAI